MRVIGERDQVLFLFFFFFFSSRRRHTRLVSDWSSDVCSSDLARHARPERRPAADQLRHGDGGADRRAHTSRSEEGRVGEEGRYRGAPDHLKKKKKKK